MIGHLLGGDLISTTPRRRFRKPSSEVKASDHGELERDNSKFLTYTTLELHLIYAPIVIYTILKPDGPTTATSQPRHRATAADL